MHFSEVNNMNAKAASGLGCRVSGWRAALHIGRSARTEGLFTHHARIFGITDRICGDITRKLHGSFIPSFSTCCYFLFYSICKCVLSVQSK